MKKIVKKFYKTHRYIIYFTFIAFILAYVSNVFVEKQRVFLSGDNLSSLDYQGHIKTILKDFSNGGLYSIDNTNCIDCPQFYQHSRWSELSIFILMEIGSLLGLHPFIWYIFFVVVTQVISLYVLFRVLFKKFFPLPFFIASFVFIFFPLHLNLFIVSLYGIVNGFFVAGIAMLLYLIKNMERLEFKKFLFSVGIFALISSFFLNATIIYLPFYFYTCVFICIYYFRKVRKNFGRFIFLGGVSLLLITVINIPILITIKHQLLGGETLKEYGGYISYPFWDSMSALSLSQGLSNTNTILLFACILFLFYKSSLKTGSKKIIIGIYLFTVLLLMGIYSPINIFEQIFLHMPLMRIVRSTYRMGLFQILVVTIITYSGLVSLTSRKIKISIGFILFLILGYHMINTINLFHSVVIPNEYFQTKEYFKNNESKKIYFPSYLPVFVSMTGNYTWYNFTPKWNSIYGNPFTSILTLDNIFSPEAWEVSDRVREIRVMSDYGLKSEEIINTLEYAGISYIIIDKNFNWSKIFPFFDINEFTKHLTLEKKFGSVYIYKLHPKENMCKKAFGGYKSGFCVSNTPLYLIGITNKDYNLDLLEQTTNKYKVRKNSSIKLVTGIYSNQLQDYITTKRIFIPFKVYEPEGNVENLFEVNLTQGTYVLQIPLLVLPRKTNLFMDSSIVIKINGKVYKKLTPYHDDQMNTNKVIWEEFLLNLKDKANHILSISTTGKGVVLTASPLLFTKNEWEQFEKSVHNTEKKHILIN
jgi:hypothetical protein